MVGGIALGLIICTIMVVSGVRAENAGSGQEDMAIRKAAESSVEAYNRGGASAAASHWVKEGSYVDDTCEQ